MATQQKTPGARVGTADVTPPTEVDKPRSSEDRLSEIEARLSWIEENTPGLPRRETAEADQETRDNEILSRRPNSYPEAVAFKEAEERRDRRRKASQRDDETPPKSEG